MNRISKPLQNRITPTGEIVADPARGLFMGNRGILHGQHRSLGAARWRHPHWIICRLAFRGRQRKVMAPGRYTELFFLDEATALAAGHRPCAECRREAWLRFRDAWRAAAGAETERCAPAIDRVLHQARVQSRTRRQVPHEARLGALPDGTFIRHGGALFLVLGDRLLPWHPGGYGRSLRRPADQIVTVLTPRPTVAVLTAGYRPVLHPSATGT